MGLYDFTFYNVIDRNAFCFKQKPAWYEVDQDITLTFSEYKERVDRLAVGLQNSGISRGQPSAPSCSPSTGGSPVTRWRTI